MNVIKFGFLYAFLIFKLYILFKHEFRRVFIRTFLNKHKIKIKLILYKILELFSSILIVLYMSP